MHHLQVLHKRFFVGDAILSRIVIFSDLQFVVISLLLQLIFFDFTFLRGGGLEKLKLGYKNDIRLYIILQNTSVSITNSRS